MAEGFRLMGQRLIMKKIHLSIKHFPRTDQSYIYSLVSLKLN